MLDLHALPNDVEGLRRFLIERERALQTELREKQHQIEHLKFQLAQLRHARFGQTSEQLESAGQLPLTLDALQAAVDQAMREAEALCEQTPTVAKAKPVRRKHLPEHFERVTEMIEPKGCLCQECGGVLQAFGKADESEVLEVKTVTFTVRAPDSAEKALRKMLEHRTGAGPFTTDPEELCGGLAPRLGLDVEVRLSLAALSAVPDLRAGGAFDQSHDLMQWVGASSELLGPLVAALAKYVLSAPNLNADDTPIKVLAPGTGKTRRGRLWTYVRDGRPWKSRDPPAVWYQYSPSWHGVYPQKHLAAYRGKLQVDAYAGFDPLFAPSRPNVPARILEISCAAHMRRKFFEVHSALKSPLAKEALDRFAELYAIEAQIRGRAPEERRAVRQEHAVPLLKAFRAWMLEKLGQVENKSALAAALHYSINQWEALVRYTEDGRLEIDNNAAERSIRGMGVGRRNYLFFGSDTGGERAAIIYALIETCKLNEIDPQRYLEYVLERIAEHPINRVEELLPWHVADKLGALHPPAQRVAA